MTNNTELPRLIESNARTYILNTLEHCRGNRVRLYYIIFNVSVLIMFVSVFGIVLYYCQKKQLTCDEKNAKILKDQQYVLSKIRDFEIQNANGHMSLTKLPVLHKTT